jgi:hypothetical protein
MDYKRCTNADLMEMANDGDMGAEEELARRQSRKVVSNPPKRANVSAPKAKSKKAKGRMTKAERQANWSPAKKAFVARVRKVMARAQDIMAQLGWEPGAAMSQAWSEEKAGRLQGYKAPSRTKSEEARKLVESKGFKNNPFYGTYPF